LKISVYRRPNRDPHIRIGRLLLPSWYQMSYVLMFAVLGFLAGGGWRAALLIFVPCSLLALWGANDGEKK
jgi:hypothetical protein